MSPTPQKQGGTTSDEKFLLAVGTLLMLIIVLLAVLYLRERHHRLDAELWVAELRTTNHRLQSVMGNILMERGPFSDGPVPREELPRRVVTVDGRRRTLLLLDEDFGRQLGFAPGDWICVGPTTRPAEAQTPASEPTTTPH